MESASRQVDTAAPGGILECVAGFLGRVPALRPLGPGELQALAERVLVDFCPAGTAILSEGDAPSEHLRIIVSGGVRVSLPAGEGSDVEVDYRSEGAAIGYLSLLSGDPARVNATAVEDTVCYLIPRDDFLALLERRPDVREFFTRTFLSTYLDAAFSDLRADSLASGSGEQLLFTTPVGRLASRRPVTAPAGVSVREAARLMSRHRVSSLVLTGADGAPAGIVTDRDLRERVAAPGADAGQPVRGIMSPVTVSAAPGDLCFEALLTMIRHGVHHLPVIDDGRLVAMLTNHDLMMVQGRSPLTVVREIENQRDVAGLARAARQIDAMISLLLREGARAGNVARVITEMNDRLVRKAIELAGRGVPPAPLPWCWVGFGSEGRREQTFKTDQDNAIVYAEPGDEEQAQLAREWFAAFAPKVRDALAACGFPPCEAGYMAANPEWRKPLSEWKRLFSSWVAEPDGRAVLGALILFDFRPLHGEERLARDLRQHLTAAIARTPSFLGFMANQIVKNPPPLGFLNRIVVEREGQHRDRLNLKLRAIAPIVDLARLFALEKGCQETGTLDRLHWLRPQHTIVGSCGEELEQAFEFLMSLRIHHQHAQVAAGLAPDNFVDPNTLTALEKKTAREAFRLVARLQGLVVERYRAYIL